MFHKKALMVLILISGLLLPSLVGAQSSSGLDGKLTLFPDEPCSLEFWEFDVQDALRTLAKPYNVNLLINQKVKGKKVTVSFHEVPVREAFLAILKDAGLGYVQEGKILRVDTIERMEKTINQRRKTRDATKKAAEPITRQIQVKYAFDSENSKDLTELAEELEKLLSKDKAAKLSTIKRTNTLLVTDLPENVAKIQALLAKLDKPSKQIAITAKIISATDDFARELGIQWGGSNTNKMGSNTIKAQGGNNTGGSSVSGENYAVNLPAASVAQGVGGSINLLIGTIGGDILEMQLSAMERESKGKVLSSPRVITQDNQVAKMESVHEAFYSVTNTSASSVTTQSYETQEVKIALEVTPHVIGEQIFMDVKVERGNLLPVVTAGIPRDIKTNTLTTKVLVTSGETVVIGGLIEEDATNVEGGIPWLRDIPLLGWLFSYQTKSDDKKELLIFITPTILEDGQQAVDVSTSSGPGA